MERTHEVKSIRFLLVLIVFLMVGCDENGSTEKRSPGNEYDSEDKQDEPFEKEMHQDSIRIGFSMDTLEEERWTRDRDLFKQAVENLGAEVEVKAAYGNTALQISQAETLISQGVDLLVLVPHNAEAAATIVGKAQMANIPVVSYDRLVMNANIDLYITFDSQQVGELQAEAITELVPKGNYVYIGGAETDNNAHMLKNGVFHVLQPFIDQGDITVVYDQWTEGWIPENAKLNMQEALLANDNRIDAVIAANDATASGVIEALKEQGLDGDIPVAGQDAELAGIKRIVEGTQSMTVYKPIHVLAEQAAEIVVRMAQGETIETNSKINNGKKEVPTVFLAPIAVNQKNIEETIIADGFHSREEIFGQD